MKEYKVMIYNVRTGAVWFATKMFAGPDEAAAYCKKRTDNMYLVSIIG